MEIFWFIFLLSVPIFYVWGAYAFVRLLFFRRESPPQHDPAAVKRMLLAELNERADARPELTVAEFLEEVQERRAPASEPEPAPQPPIAEVAPSTQAESLDPEFKAAMEGDTEPVTRLGELLPQSAPPAPTFSWRNWYRDNAINLLLYLGAFLIVAAVSLFVGFQWKNLDSTTRFGVVIAFTIAWYVAGSFMNRVLSLEMVGTTFITIGALLTPFCGVAWQRFMVGSMAGVGWTWLITATISTIIYLYLSFAYHQRYFTYFGNLSILAMILSLVQINNAPSEYFILAGALTGLLLLIARIGLQYTTHLNAFLRG